MKKRSSTLSWCVLQLGGVDIYINFTFLFAVIYALWEARPLSLGRISTAFLLLIILFISILLHELGHAIAAYWCGIATKRITLWLFGGFAELEYQPISNSDVFTVYIAGLVVNMLLICISAGFTAFIAVILSSEGYSIPNIDSIEDIYKYPTLYSFLYYIMLTNFTLVFINSLPALPLDGGYIFRVIISVFTKPKWTILIMRTIGSCLSIIITYYAIIYRDFFLIFMAIIIFLSSFFLTIYLPFNRSSISIDTENIQPTKKRSLMVVLLGVIDIFISIPFVSIAMIMSYVIMYAIQYNLDTVDTSTKWFFIIIILICILSFILFLLFILAGIGLLLRRRIAYYVHMIACGVLIITGIGLIYSIPAIIVARKNKFRSDFDL